MTANKPHSINGEATQCRIELADARDWMAAQRAGSAKVIVYDPPYAVGTPVRGREDGAAGSVFAPFAFLHMTLTECCRILVPGGIVMMFADWRRMPDLFYLASISGLRASTKVAWIRNRPGTGGLMRSSHDEIGIVARGVPDAVDRKAVRNVIETTEAEPDAAEAFASLDSEPVIKADYDTRRKHPYGKPSEVFRHVFSRVCRPGDMVVDPFAGSGVSRRVAAELGLSWSGCDIDPVYADEDGFALKSA